MKLTHTILGGGKSPPSLSIACQYLCQGPVHLWECFALGMSWGQDKS